MSPPAFGMGRLLQHSTRHLVDSVRVHRAGHAQQNGGRIQLLELAPGQGQNARAGADHGRGGLPRAQAHLCRQCLRRHSMGVVQGQRLGIARPPPFPPDRKKRQPQQGCGEQAKQHRPQSCIHADTCF